MSKYEYGKSIIKTKLKYEFNNKNSAYNIPIESLHVDLVIYNGKKKVRFKNGKLEYTNSFKNLSVNQVIELIFNDEIEKQAELEKGKNYYTVFKAYELKKAKKRLYKPTNQFEDYDRRFGIITERINFFYA